MTTIRQKIDHVVPARCSTCPPRHASLRVLTSRTQRPTTALPYPEAWRRDCSPTGRLATPR